MLKAKAARNTKRTIGIGRDFYRPRNGRKILKDQC
jgi:hypothetical protein